MTSFVKRKISKVRLRFDTGHPRKCEFTHSLTLVIALLPVGAGFLLFRYHKVLASTCTVLVRNQRNTEGGRWPKC